MRWALPAILILAAALRLPGIAWGLPDAAHPEYSYHPDEAVSVAWAADLTRGELTLKQFQYGGTLHMSMLNAYAHLGQLLHPWLHRALPLADTILAGRYFVVLLSLLGILITYEAGRQLFDRSVGLLAALLLALAPGHAFLAQNVRPDEAAVVVSALLLWLSASILRVAPKHDFPRFIACGLVIGTGIALRFPLAVFGVAPLCAWLLREPPRTARELLDRFLDRRVIAIVAATLIGYAVASPHSFVYWRQLIEGVSVAMGYQSAPYVDAVGRGPGLYQYGWTKLSQSLGLPFYLLSCAGIVYAAVRRSREQVLLLVSFLPYLILTTFASWVVIRYTLPMLPALCVLAASAVVDALCARAVRRLIAAIVTVLAIAWTLLADAAYANMEAQRNVRDECGDWIAAHAKPGSSLASVWQYDGDVYLSPTVSGDLELFGLVPKANDPEQLTRDGGFDFIAVNAEVYGALERLGDRHPNPGIREFQHQLQRGPYRLVAQCAKPVRLLGVDFANAFSALDYAVVNPGIRVYQHD